MLFPLTWFIFELNNIRINLREITLELQKRDKAILTVISYASLFKKNCLY
jgi:hypothetical protein